MGNSLQNTFSIPVALFKLINDLKRQKRFMRLNIDPLLNQSKLTNDGTLNDKDFLKINKYYGLAVPAILGESFGELRGYGLSDSERWVSTGQGVITGLFDDFFDDLKLPEEQLVNMILNPDNVVPQSSNVKLFTTFYSIVLQKAAHPDLIKKQFIKVHEAQVASVEQENLNLDTDRIWEITCQKGGDSVLFYRTAFDNLPKAGEEEALYQLGSLMQFENDIFDIYKDYDSKIATLPTTISKVESLRSLYEKGLREFISLSKNMDYPLKQITNFLDIVIPVLNRGFVCLDNYQNLENTNNGKFDLSIWTRKQLICDMEKPSSLFRTMYYQIIIKY